MTSPEWQEYELPPADPPDERVLLSFDEVYHVTHPRHARRILEEGALQPRLVFDESRLNTKRIRVVWLSPNTWVRGYIYGNIRFAYDWDELLGSNNVYWVESMEQYAYPALRFLITPEDWDDAAMLSKYDPREMRGPWRYDDSEGVHYRHKRHTLEFMFEGDLPLASCEQVDFVDHHSEHCSIHGWACEYRNRLPGLVGAEFLATVIAQGIDPTPLGLTSGSEGEIAPSGALTDAWAWLMGKIERKAERFHGGLRFPGSERAHARAVFAAFGRQDDEELKALCSCFGSPQQLQSACTELLAESLGLSTTDSLR